MVNESGSRLTTIPLNFFTSSCGTARASGRLDFVAKCPAAYALPAPADTRTKATVINLSTLLLLILINLLLFSFGLKARVSLLFFEQRSPTLSKACAAFASPWGRLAVLFMNRNEARSAAILLILTVFVIEEHSSQQKAQKLIRKT